MSKREIRKYPLDIINRCQVCGAIVDVKNLSALAHWRLAVLADILRKHIESPKKETVMGCIDLVNAAINDATEDFGTSSTSTSRDLDE